MTIHFYEVDGGPAGMWWESHGDMGYLNTFHRTDDMIAAARLVHRLGGDYRVHTQEEFNLRWEIEENG